MIRIRRALPLLPLVLAAGCAVGPDFQPPAAPQAERYTAAPLPAETVATAGPGGEAQRFLDGKPVPAQWWKLFGSPKLDALVEDALRASPNVASAQAALRVAQENLRAQGATLYPSVDAHFTATRQKIDTASFGNPGGRSVIYNLYNASVGVSYGLDLWGGTRRGVEAQRAATEAQAYELEATYQTLIANIVTAAVREAEQATLIVGQVAIVDDQQKLLAVTEKQAGFGAIGPAELLSAQSNLATERAKLPPLRLAQAQAQNQLAVYVGKLPSEQVPSNFELPDLKLPQDLPLSLPSSLVQQRPDVKAAEARLHQAAANIGVATANLLPQITLNASFGTQASVLDNLFQGNLWSIGGALTQPLFHAGELTARRRAAIAAYEQAAADYRQTVLTAFQNVADALRALELDAESLNAQSAAADAAGRSLTLIETQYRLGSASYLSLLTAQQQYTRARAGAVVATAARLADTAALFQALGGGWSAGNASTGPGTPSPATDAVAH